ncbi:hypothetical protein N7516_001797 [Penicillium verrucosum]|uniref:uncharacterized protein n=1 Tax=Penicillium verrucosum TaxID=60171 RepID=UPI0025455954|nr:uncharacterized protein N7516_001797 [Penicillium verrucosum]KAJ5941629.1 hypothetical protein N7516_001797 [Penicillium verrucosum]
MEGARRSGPKMTRQVTRLPKTESPRDFSTSRNSTTSSILIDPNVIGIERYRYRYRCGVIE